MDIEFRPRSKSGWQFFKFTKNKYLEIKNFKLSNFYVSKEFKFLEADGIMNLINWEITEITINKGTFVEAYNLKTDKIIIKGINTIGRETILFNIKGEDNLV